MTRWNLAAVVGVPGVGKTSLCSKLAASKDYKNINYGEMMLSLARDKGLASTQNEMFRLPLKIQFEFWKEAAYSIKDEKNVLIDLHGLDRISKGYLISLPLEILKPQIIILVESAYENIINRRMMDRNRERPLMSYRALAEEMELLRNVVSFTSVLSGCLLVLINNDDFDETLNRLKKYV